MTTTLVDRDEPGEPQVSPDEPARALDDILERIKREPPVDQYLLERLLDGLRALQSSPTPYQWRPGFLSCLLHAVPTDGEEWEYLDQTIQWSACGAPALKTDITGWRSRCPRCEELDWSTR